MFEGNLKIFRIYIIIQCIALIYSCAILKEPTVRKNGTIDNYKYVVIPNTESLNSESGAIVGGEYGVYGATTSKEVNPGALIEGILLKRGLISMDDVKPELIENTLIVRYGESGKRKSSTGLGGYTLEVTILIVDAHSHDIVYSCTAEGQGTTEADDIREAISRCLSQL